VVSRGLFIAIALLAGCDKPTGPELDASTVCAPMMVTVTPATPMVPVGMTVQLTATLTCANGVTRDITAQADWQTFDTFTATVSSAGLVTTKKAGSTTITATSAGLTGMAALTVRPI
jgi:uncharacterized protein YjdB